jgi:hypothetical protein
MPTLFWRGDAQPVAQVNTVTPGGTIGTETFTIAINRKEVSYTATTGDAVADVCEGLVAAFLAVQNDGYHPEFDEVTVADATTHVTLTGPASGKPFVNTSSATGAATCVTATTTEATGPNHFDNADNWQTVGSTTPTKVAAGDTVYYQGTNVDCLYGLDDLSGSTLAAVYIMASYTGKIGLPEINADANNKYVEYRDRYLQVGITALYIGQGEGNGSSRIRIDLETVNSTIEVYQTANSSDDFPPFCYHSSGTTTVLRVFKGHVGVAVTEAGQTANLTTLTIGKEASVAADATVEIGTGCATITTATKSGGTLIVDDVGITTFEQTAGSTEIRGAVLPTTCRVYGGEVKVGGSGTITTLVVAKGGVMDFNLSQVSRTVTNCTIEAGATLLDSESTVTWTNPITLNRARLPGNGENALAKLDLGTHITLAVGAGA